jgi:hypothetical protein
VVLQGRGSGRLLVAGTRIERATPASEIPFLTPFGTWFWMKNARVISKDTGICQATAKVRSPIQASTVAPRRSPEGASRPEVQTGRRRRINAAGQQPAARPAVMLGFFVLADRGGLFL